MHAKRHNYDYAHACACTCVFMHVQYNLMSTTKQDDHLQLERFALGELAKNQSNGIN